VPQKEAVLAFYDELRPEELNFESEKILPAVRAAQNLSQEMSFLKQMGQ
jgi:hypothetical protein